MASRQAFCDSDWRGCIGLELQSLRQGLEHPHLKVDSGGGSDTGRISPFRWGLCALERPINLGELRWFPKRGPRHFAPQFFEQDKSSDPSWPMHRDGAWWQAVAGHSKRRLLTALMDQKVVAGIGNIIALESLHRVCRIVHQGRWPQRCTVDSTGKRHPNGGRSLSRAACPTASERPRGLDNPRQLRGELKLVAEGHTEAKGF